MMMQSMVALAPNTVEISFPGLGIETFTVDKVAFTVWGFSIRWYAVVIMCGMILAFLYAVWRGKQETFTPDDVLDVGLYTVVFGIIGARLYYVLMELDRYVQPSRSFWENFKSIINIRNGGLAIYGGIIAGAVTLYIVCRIKKKDWRRALDMVSPGVMLAQAIGRWGNFFNGEAHGGVVAEGSPLYFLRMGLFPNDLSNTQTVFVHPTFFYESLWNVIGFTLIHFLVYPKKKFNGQIFLSYVTWYGFGRMFIEGLRTDSLYIGSVRVSQLVGFACFLVGGGIILWQLLKIRKAQKAGAVYAPLFGDTEREAKPAVEYAIADTADSAVSAAADTADTENATKEAENGTVPENEEEKDHGKVD